MRRRYKGLLSLVCIGTVGVLLIMGFRKQVPAPVVLISVRDYNTGLLIRGVTAAAIEARSKTISKLVQWLPKGLQPGLKTNTLVVAEGVVEVPAYYLTTNTTLIWKAPGYGAVKVNGGKLEKNSGRTLIRQSGTNSFSCRMRSEGGGLW